MSTLSESIDRLAATAPGFARALAEAESVQWEIPATHSARDDTTERASGISDPTPRVALDERRLRVRAAVIEGERILEAASAEFERGTALARTVLRLYADA